MSFIDMYAELKFGEHMVDDPLYEFGEVPLPRPTSTGNLFVHQLEVTLNVCVHACASTSIDFLIL